MVEVLNKEPVYVRIASHLRESILSGKLTPGDGISSEGKLCKKFGVSRGPVRQAMDALVKERLIVRMPGRGSFVSETAKPSNTLKGTQALNITVAVDLLPELQWLPFLQDIIQGLNQAAAKTHPTCRLSFVFHQLNAESGYEILDRPYMDGLVLIPLLSDGINFLNGLTSGQLKCPVMSFFRRLDTSHISQFYVDHEEGSFRAANYLLGQGHRDMALLLIAPAEERVDSHERMDGALRAYRQAGLNTDSLSILESSPSYDSISHVLGEALAGANRPTAILVGGQVLVQPTLKLINSRGLSVPKDISLIVFDDSQEAQIHEPPLTVVRQPCVRGTRMALERFINEIRNNQLEPVRVALKPELVIRDSCAFVT